MDRLHGPVRRRRTGLRRADLRRRAAPTDFLPRKGTTRAALGLGQPGVWLVERRQAHHLPLAARLVVTSDCALVHGLGRRWPINAPPDADRRLRRLFA